MIVHNIFIDQFCTMFVNSSGSKLTDITGIWDLKIKYDVSGLTTWCFSHLSSSSIILDNSPLT